MTALLKGFLSWSQIVRRRVQRYSGCAVFFGGNHVPRELHERHFGTISAVGWPVRRSAPRQGAGSGGEQSP